MLASTMSYHKSFKFSNGVFKINTYDAYMYANRLHSGEASTIQSVSVCSVGTLIEVASN